jgi:hypothetical protein
MRATSSNLSHTLFSLTFRAQCAGQTICPSGHTAELENYMLVYIEHAMGVVIIARRAATEADLFHRLSSMQYRSRYCQQRPLGRLNNE